MKIAAVLGVSVLFAGQTLAQTSSALDSPWLPWLGCWELVDDERRDPLVGESDPTNGQDVPTRGLVCVHPSPDDQGVTVTSINGTEVFLEETLIADGERNPSSKGNCAGWQETEWSADQRRLFSTSELTCGTRLLKVSGLSMMVHRHKWVEIQVVDSDAGRAVVVRRYRPADDWNVLSAGVTPLAEDLALASSRARFRISDPLDADAVIETAQNVAPEAVEAAVVEHEEGFELDATTLVKLDEAGVRPGLIDLMVAFSYPEQFEIGSGASDDGPGASFPTAIFLGGVPTYGSRVPYTYTNPYYITPFGASYWYTPGYWYSRYNRVPNYRLVTPTPSRGVSVGRVVGGRGYTQVNSRSRTTGRRARYRAGSGDSGSYSAGSSRSSGGSRGVSSRGYSGGSGGSRGGARARQR